MPSQFYNAGVQADLAAKEYQRSHPGTNYENALRAVVRAATRGEKAQCDRLATQYEMKNGPIRADQWRIYRDVSGNITDIQVDGAGRSIGQLSNVVSGLPKLDDGSVDAELAVRIIRAEFSELGQTAAGAFLDHAARKILGESKANEGMDITGAMKVAQQQNPEVARIWAGGAMTEQALRTILWPLFKVSQPEAPAPGERSSYEQTSVRRYSADHVHHDNLGREYRRY
jgi:hypothetical protein